MKSYKVSDEESIFIKRILFTPASVCIDFEYSRPIQDETTFMMRLYDIKGNEIGINSASGKNELTGDTRKVTYTALFNGVDEIPEALRLKLINAEDESLITSIDIELDS